MLNIQHFSLKIVGFIQIGRLLIIISNTSRTPGLVFSTLTGEGNSSRRKLPIYSDINMTKWGMWRVGLNSIKVVQNNQIVF